MKNDVLVKKSSNKIDLWLKIKLTDYQWHSPTNFVSLTISGCHKIIKNIYLLLATIYYVTQQNNLKIMQLPLIQELNALK